MSYNILYCNIPQHNMLRYNISPGGAVSGGGCRGRWEQKRVQSRSNGDKRRMVAEAPSALARNSQR